ncbi:MAG: hypothetical protein U5K38_08450 [Woeseiaceae bacterium]|nr:hypothetical protein [Woeseiaceae bacterium]
MRHPFRRDKRFIRSGDTSHTAIQTDLFYLGEANGFPLNRWMRELPVAAAAVLLAGYRRGLRTGP